METNAWWIGALILLAILVGTAIPVLLQLRQTLRSLQFFLDKTGRRLDEALDEITEMAERLNKVGGELEEGAKHVRFLFDVAGDVGKTVGSLRDSFRTAASAVTAVAPAIVAAIRAIWPPNEEDSGNEGKQDGDCRPAAEEDAPVVHPAPVRTFGGEEETRS